MAGETSKEGDVEQAKKDYESYSNRGPVKTYGLTLNKVQAIPPSKDPELRALQDTRQAVVDPSGGAPLAQPSNEYGAGDAALDIFGMSGIGAPGAMASAAMGGPRYGVARIYGGAADMAGNALGRPGGDTVWGPGVAPTETTPAIPPVTGGQAADWGQAQDPTMVLQSKPTGGRWRSNISPGAREDLSDAQDWVGAGTAQEIGYAKQGEREAAAIQQTARQDAANQTAAQIGRAEGAYMTSMNAQKQLEQIQMDSQHEADDAMKQVRNGKIDPKHFYAQNDTLTNIGLALSVAMGSYWQTVAGGQNDALAIIDKAIDRDIRAQEVNLGNKRAYADSALRRNLMATGNLDRAKELTRIQMLELTRLETQKMAMDNQSAVEQANHSKVMAMLEGSINKSLGNLALIRANERIEHESYVQPQQGNSLILKQGMADAENYVPGLGIVPEKLYKDAAEKTAEMAHFQSIMNQIAKQTADISQAQKAGGAVWDAFKSDNMRNLEALVQEARFLDSKSMLSQGVIREHEVKQFDQLVGDPLSFYQNPDANQKLVGSIAGRVNTKVNIMQKQYNAVPADIYQVQTPSGVHRVALPRVQKQSELGKSAFEGGTQSGPVLQSTIGK